MTARKKRQQSRPQKSRAEASKLNRQSVKRVAQAVSRKKHSTYEVVAKCGRYRRSVVVVTATPQQARRAGKSYFECMFPDREITNFEVICWD
jgi:hypothetical protein